MLKVTKKDGNLTVYYVEKKKNKTLNMKTISLNADFEDIQNLYCDLDAKFKGNSVKMHSSMLKTMVGFIFYLACSNKFG